MAIDVNMKGKVIDVTQVRNRPSLSGEVIHVIYPGVELYITSIEGEWLKITRFNGWVHESTISLLNNDNNSRIVNMSKQEQEYMIARNNRLSEKEKYNRIDNFNLSTEDTDGNNIIADSLIVNNLNGIYGIPYQFMESVDSRIQGSSTQNTDGIGTKYAEKILTKMPLLYITPGTAKFMSNYTKEERQSVAKYLQFSGADSDETSLVDLITHEGKYFTFEFAYESYFEYVDALCQAGARYLNIHELELNIGDGVNKKTAGKFKWQNALNSNLKATLTSQSFIGFYVDSPDSVSESFSNGTTQSQLSEMINGFSNTAKELGFLLGAGAGIQFQFNEDNKINELIDGIDDITKKYVNDGFLKNLGTNFRTVATGGKMLFPEIWSDSQFSRDVSFTIKLRTPDSDVVSWYMNIFVPLCHLIALAAGHQMNSPNGYYSPFLIRAYYKGLFNVDMGIIESMGIKRGADAAWNIDGLPTEVDVDITIKDLYNMLSIVPGTEPKTFVTNSLLMDYIANSCGVNINKIDIARSLDIYRILFTDKFVSIPNRIGRKIQDAIDNYGMELYNKILDRFLI